MNYQESVTEAAAALIRGEDANWELARLTYENTNTGHGDRSKVTMEQWCSDVRNESGRKFSTTEGKRYKRIWAEHGTNRPAPVHLSWTEAYMSFDDRGNGFDRPDQIERQATEATPDQKRSMFKKLAADPDVTDDLATRSEATRQIEAATGRATHQRQRKEDADTKPIRESFEMMRALGAINDIIDKAAFIGRVWREHAESWTEEERNTMKSMWADAQKEIGYTDESITTGAAWSMAELET